MRHTGLIIVAITLLLGACGNAPQIVQSPPSTAPSPTLSATSESLLDSPVLESGAAAPEPSPTPDGEPAATHAPPPSGTATPEPTAQLLLDPTRGPGADATAVPAALPAESQAAAAPAQPAAPGVPVRIVIPAIDMDRPLVSVGLDPNNIPIVPKHDVGWYNLSARPGQGENIVLWGHVLRFKNAPQIPAPFARLKELAPGATVTLFDEAGNARDYVVTRHVWATPDQVDYILPKGKEMVTMVSCIGEKVITQNGVEMTNRLITIAEPAS